MRKERKNYACISRILGIEGVDARTTGNLFKAVIQAFLFFGSESWVLNPHTGWSLGGFQHRMARQMGGKQLWHLTGGGW